MKTDLFLRANTGRPGDASAPPPPLPKAFFASENAGSVPSPLGGGRRETRMPDGKAACVGVAGRTLTEEWGERAAREPEAVLRPEGLARLVLEVEEALERVCWWLGPLVEGGKVLRMEETEEEVLLRPRRPEERR